MCVYGSPQFDSLGIKIQVHSDGKMSLLMKELCTCYSVLFSLLTHFQIINVDVFLPGQRAFVPLIHSVSVHQDCVSAPIDVTKIKYHVLWKEEICSLSKSPL